MTLKDRPLELSARDKSAMQRATRYADTLHKPRMFEFDIRHGQILFQQPGTTSRAWFNSPREEAEKYVGTLAAFAFKRLGKKYSYAAQLIRPEVYVLWDEKRYELNLGELVVEATGSTIQEWAA